MSANIHADFAAMPGDVERAPGGAVSDGRNLWVELDTRSQRDIEELRPAEKGSERLAIIDRGRLAGRRTPATLESIGSPGAANVVAAAVPGLIRVFDGPSVIDVADPLTAGASQIIPVGGCVRQGWFLYRIGRSWFLSGADIGGHLLRTTELASLDPVARLATPVSSGGQIFVMAIPERGQASLWTLDPLTASIRPVPGFRLYPRAGPAEVADFSGAEIVASGPTVVFDNPDSLLALVVFSDGSAPPTVVDKSAAVALDVSGPALVDRPDSPAANPTQAPSPPTTAQPLPLPSPSRVDPKSSCMTTTQTPRVPRITEIAPGARSAMVTWSYPFLDSQDCEPDTWTIRVVAIDAAQPPSPQQIEHGQQSYELTGLRPATNYEVIVTATINRRSTASAASSFSTLPTGADPPGAVVTSADNAGHWFVQWSPCVADGCVVPASSWTVTGSACANTFVSQPPTLQLDASHTSAEFDAAALGLLGSRLSFEVQGISAAGLSGDPTSDDSCTEAWRPPDPQHISLQDAAVAAGESINVTLQVGTSEPTEAAFGSSSTLFTYRVGNASIGPTSATSATFRGLEPGTIYQPSVTVAPLGHPEAAVVVNGPALTQTVPWPDMGVAVSSAVEGANPNSGTVTASFSGLPDVPTSATGTITCGNTIQQVEATVSPSATATFTMNLDELGGNCSLTVTLAELASHRFGIRSQPLTAAFSIGTQPDSASFSATYERSSGAWVVLVDGDSGGKGIGWRVAVSAPPSCVGQPGGSLTGDPIAFPVTLSIGSCGPKGNGAVQVTISWSYLGVSVLLPPIPVGGGQNPPGSTTTSSTTTTSSPADSTTSTSNAAGGVSTKPAGPPPSVSRQSSSQQIDRVGVVTEGVASATTTLALLVLQLGAWVLNRREKQRGK